MGDRGVPRRPGHGYLERDMFDLSRVRAWHRAVGARISERGQALMRRMPPIAADESTMLVLFAVGIGGTVGFAVIAFYKLIDLAQIAALSAANTLTGAGRVSILLVVLAGLAIARSLVRFGAKDSDGDNVPDVMRAVAKRGGIIHAWPVAVKTASAAIAIGAGGSAGAEGPVAVAGSALGSRIGRFFRSGPGRLKVLVACGAAAGISAAFNAPIAGVFFSLEKVLGTFGVSAFPPILVASVIAAVISRSAFGDSPVIAIPVEYGVGPANEFILYALLGIATGLVAVLYTRTVHATAARLDTVGSWWQQIVLAGIVVGALNIVFRADLWGQGHQTVGLGIIAQRPAYFLVALAMAKLLATAVTVGATRAGGVFTPALFIGAMIGGGFAVAARDLLPGFAIEPEAFALVGMAGLVAASTHAPLTAIMMVFEMTSDYALILPLMLCGAIAYITARRLHPHSIYSEWLVRRGEHISFGRDTAILERLTVRHSLDPHPRVIAENAPVSDITEAVGATTQIEFPVIAADGTLVGMLTYGDIRTVLSEASALASLVVAGDLVTDQYERVTPQDTLLTALHRLAVRGTHHIPVVDVAHGDRLIGLVSRGAVLSAYDRELLKET